MGTTYTRKAMQKKPPNIMLMNTVQKDANDVGLPERPRHYRRGAWGSRFLPTVPIDFFTDDQAAKTTAVYAKTPIDSCRLRGSKNGRRATMSKPTEKLRLDCLT